MKFKISNIGKLQLFSCTLSTSTYLFNARSRSVCVWRPAGGEASWGWGRDAEDKSPGLGARRATGACRRGTGLQATGENPRPSDPDGACRGGNEKSAGQTHHWRRVDCAAQEVRRRARWRHRRQEIDRKKEIDAWDIQWTLADIRPAPAVKRIPALTVAVRLWKKSRFLKFLLDTWEMSMQYLVVCFRSFTDTKPFAAVFLLEFWRLLFSVSHCFNELLRIALHENNVVKYKLG